MEQRFSHKSKILTLFQGLDLSHFSDTHTIETLEMSVQLQKGCITYNKGLENDMCILKRSVSDLVRLFMCVYVFLLFQFAGVCVCGGGDKKTQRQKDAFARCRLCNDERSLPQC